MNPDVIELNDRSVNFGGGIELLMNDRKPSFSGEINIDDLTNLENELNDLVLEKPSESIFSSTFSLSDVPGPSVTFSEIPAKEPSLVPDEPNSVPPASEPETPAFSFSKLGESTSTQSEPKTWDGFGKFNNVPIQPDKAVPPPQLSKEEMLREKLKILRKLEALEAKGVNLSKKYSMESNLLEMQGEYELIME